MKLALLKGVFIDGTRGKFIAIKYGKKRRKNIMVQCTEGRNHFVKKMFTTINYTVEKLHRSSFAGIVPDIPIGSYRKLNKR
jgi:16S rRNA U516 pseudouridylate synthase RsuA-like enzyme